jgi:hypothetical protein
MQISDHVFPGESQIIFSDFSLQVFFCMRFQGVFDRGWFGFDKPGDGYGAKDAKKGF